ncbi:Pantoate--beta-alanine ligase [uncultured Candidatus Thioglobus sp.]|nr:Pantoate--beta-alanine ligase [uncultured Candidatus Thioglobus sp.]
MQLLSSIKILKDCLSDWQKNQQIIALVPTMGNLHAGHLQLVRCAKKIADKVVVSIFVNPTQFVAGEDFSIYPRTIKNDLLLLEECNADIVFTPSVEEMYPTGLQGSTEISVATLGNVFCGLYRNGHFSGVATIVSKLLHVVQPNIALFGKKDYQQLLVIQQLVADMFIPVEIVGVETVREESGLALSSRNQYLNTAQHAVAANLYKTLLGIVDAVKGGAHDFSKLEANAFEYLNNQGFKTEYLSIRNATDLGLPVSVTKELVILVAAWLGEARLIDNIEFRR